jgi:hypothetical protein
MAAVTSKIPMVYSEAGISSCEEYRWWLWRCWDPSKPLCIWIMMNPSTADWQKNDPTIGKVIRYCQRWGYGGVLVLNIYAYRSSKPEGIQGRVGHRNNWWIVTMFSFAKRKRLKVICAWGASHKERGDEVRRLAVSAKLKLWCVEMAKNGEPKHPRWLSEDAIPMRLI